MIDTREARPDELIVGTWAQATSTRGGIVAGHITAVEENAIEVEGFPLPFEEWIHWEIETPKKYLPITAGSVIKWWPDWEDFGEHHLLMLDENGNWGSAQFAPRETGINKYEIVHIQTQEPS